MLSTPATGISRPRLHTSHETSRRKNPHAMQNNMALMVPTTTQADFSATQNVNGNVGGLIGGYKKSAFANEVMATPPSKSQMMHFSRPADQAEAATKASTNAGGTTRMNYAGNQAHQRGKSANASNRASIFRRNMLSNSNRNNVPLYNLGTHKRESNFDGLVQGTVVGTPNVTSQLCIQAVMPQQPFEPVSHSVAQSPTRVRSADPNSKNSAARRFKSLEFPKKQAPKKDLSVADIIGVAHTDDMLEGYNVPI